MAVSIPPKSGQSYTQAYWYAVIAAVLYTLCSSMLLINLLGYFLGRYGQHFVLTYAQRTLILQTFLFFLWLAGGAAVFTKVEGWNFSNSVSLKSLRKLVCIQSLALWTRHRAKSTSARVLCIRRILGKSFRAYYSMILYLFHG